MKIFTNYYECHICESTWKAETTSVCDDECPECGYKNISPYDY